MKNSNSLHPQLTLPKRQTLLLVDDNRLILFTMKSALELVGYNVSSATSVSKAELWLETHPRPDLVVLDLHLPERNGLELVNYLNAKNRIPFIMLTAFSEDEIIKQVNSLGARSYLVKPINTVQLIPAIENALSCASESY